ncbi:hypothetical protein BD410DRAFT_839321 [Rickenella mellea]|uniref:N-acetyltransferase domain-containing protein n=1 Tax=Rickenella mellea TaxID=50990 RepID=A0A4Y7Q6R2_9AGAM|nr:hypothetical protein BD410DRAFT_839321 [Rickenella mellea]
MSSTAYNSPVDIATTLQTTLWHLPLKSSTSEFATSAPTFITIHHLRLDTARKFPGLLDSLYKEFTSDVASGRSLFDTQTASHDMFEAYFFAESLFLGIAHNSIVFHWQGDERSVEGMLMGVAAVSVEDARASRPWEECLAGFYSVRPNFPGRSSHIAGAAIIISTKHRQQGIGHVLARSMLYYAPRLGYSAGLANLVFANNPASIRLWESLHCTKIARIPRVGRFSRADGQGDEYVDGFMFYKEFSESRKDSPWASMSKRALTKASL